jgi:hypothetical protein
MNMRKRTLLGTTFALLALSASIAGVTAGTADARPIAGSCDAIYQSMSDSADMAQAYYADGDEAMGDSWMRIYWMASRNYANKCSS